MIQNHTLLSLQSHMRITAKDPIEHRLECLEVAARTNHGLYSQRSDFEGAAIYSPIITMVEQCTTWEEMQTVANAFEKFVDIVDKSQPIWSNIDDGWKEAYLKLVLVRGFTTQIELSGLGIDFNDLRFQEVMRDFKIDVHDMSQQGDVRVSPPFEPVDSIEYANDLKLAIAKLLDSAHNHPTSFNPADLINEFRLNAQLDIFIVSHRNLLCAADVGIEMGLEASATAKLYTFLISLGSIKNQFLSLFSKRSELELNYFKLASKIGWGTLFSKDFANFSEMWSGKVKSST